jgi:hypothetical protein
MAMVQGEVEGVAGTGNGFFGVVSGATTYSPQYTQPGSSRAEARSRRVFMAWEK